MSYGGERERISRLCGNWRGRRTERVLEAAENDQDSEDGGAGTDCLELFKGGKKQ